MRNRSNRPALIALIAVFACLLIAAGAGLYHAKSKSLESLKNTLARRQAEVEKAKVEVEKLSALEASYEALHQRVSVLEPALPTEAYIPTFLSQIQNLAGESNNRLLLIKPKAKRKLPVASSNPEEDVVSPEKASPKNAALRPKAKEPESPYDEIGIEVGLEGNYWSAIEFLEKLKAFPKMIAVNDLAVKPKSIGRAAVMQPSLEITVQLTAVMAKEK